MNKKHIMAAAAAALCASSVAFADIPMAYYASLDGKCGQELKTAIHNLVSTSVKMLSYGSGQEHTWWGFYVTDYQMDGTKRQVIDRYSNDVRYFGNRGSSVSGMNIEHSFPKSWWGGTSNNAYKDLYNLMPCEQSINSSKSNYGMGVVTNVTTENGCTKVGTGADGIKLWEPADKWKGDFSRGYMYMATAYQDFTWEGQGLNSLQQGAYPTLKPWASELYIKWAKADPVAQIEIERNQAVADIQGNRNPFIDFPNLMEYVWGDSISTPLNLRTTLKSSAVSGDSGEDTPIPVILYNETFKATDGGCTTSGTADIWKINSKYGYVGSAYYSNAAHEADASITTPVISLKNLLTATMSFSHAANKLSSNAPTTFFSVSIIKDGGTPVDISSKFSWPKGTNWNFVDTEMDLAEYIGHEIQLVFRYTSTASVAGTWEITNLKVGGTQTAGIEDIIVPDDADNDADLNAPVEYYSLDGRRIDPATARGLVIIRQGRRVTKTIIR